MSLTGENGTQLTMPVMPAGMGGYNTGNFGGDSWWGILLLIAIMNGGWGGFGGFGGMGGLMGMWPFMFGGFGNGLGGNQGALTRGELCQDMNFQSVENGVRGIQQGLCDGFYAMRDAVSGVGTTVMQGFSQTEIAEAQRQAALMQQLSALGYQQKDCCCETQRIIERSNYDAAIHSGATDRMIERGFCDTNYAQSTNTNAIIQNSHNDTDRILARLDAMERNQDKAKIAEQAAEIQAYKQNAVFGARIDAATAEILRRTGNDCPVNAYVVQPPQPVSFATNCSGQATFNNGWGNNGYGYNNGCGCNSGCCGCAA